MSQKPTHMERVEEVFTAVLEYPAEQRHAQLHLLCGEDKELVSELESLLHAAEKAQGFLSVGPLATCGADMPAQDTSAIIGQQIDSWRILQELDSGGMGIVFLAERNDGHYQQQVAIKLAKLGLTSSEMLERFHTERQILANLRHPNIAQLLDGGTGPDGHSYLVMEYVQGVSIDNWCDSNCQSISQILQLMLPVCDAVSYAHRNLIVHCDLKPSNILVSEGVPKLLDFGIATLLAPTHVPETSVYTQQSDSSTLMTPTFASPEQIKGEPISTATDIYAFGVVLYRLLSGHYPYSVTGVSRSELANAVLSFDVCPPSEKAGKEKKAQLQGDLDNIVMKALAKDPQQRYTSIQALSNDLQQYMAGFPVSVTPNTWWYRCRKFTLRNKWGVALTAVAALSLWAGSVFSVWQWRIAMDKQNLAEERFADVRNMINTLVDELPKTMASQPGSTQLRVQLLDQGITKLDELVNSQSDNDDLMRELTIAYQQLGSLQGYPASVNLGEPLKAAATYEKSLALQYRLQKKYPDDMQLAVEIAKNYNALTLIYFGALGEADIGFEYVDKCQSILKPWASTSEDVVLKLLISCYTMEAKIRSHDKQYQPAINALSVAQKLLSEPANRAFKNTYWGLTQRARWHEEWAEVEANIGSKQKALQHEQDRLDITLSRGQSDLSIKHPYGSERSTGDAYQAYGARLAAVGRQEEAEQAYRKSEQIWLSIRERFPADTTATRSLAYVYSDIAELHKTISSTDDSVSSASRRQSQACNAYKLSVDNLKKMPGNRRKMARRYSWSPEPQLILQRYEEYCLD